MKKTMFLYFSVLIPLLGIMACVFDSDDEGISSFLNHEGLPLNYKVQTLVIDSIEPTSAISYLDEFPYSVDGRAVLGTSFDLNHDLFLDFAFKDENFFSGFSSDDSAQGQLEFYLLSEFYTSTSLSFMDSLPIKENLNLSYSWILNTGKGKEFVDSIGRITNSDWYKKLDSWKEVSYDTVYSLNIDNYDSLVILPIPKELIKAMKKVGDACHLQLKISAKETTHLYRLNGIRAGLMPVLRLKGREKTFIGLSPFRMAAKSSYIKEVNEPQLLHGGGLRESIVVDLPKEKILNALSDFYGDEFPFTEGDSMDVRQMVVLAEVKIPLDEETCKNTLNKPIQMVGASMVDSLGESIRKMELYKINSDFVKMNGHPNMVFNGSDTLSIQVTYGMRDFINKASSKENFRFIAHLSYPVLQPNDPIYGDYINADGDSIYYFFSHFDYVYYDLAPSLKNPLTLKLWLATKRGED